MPTGYVLINYDIGTEDMSIGKLKNVPGLVEVREVNGVYDIVVKISSQSLDDLKDHNTTYKTNRYNQIDDDANGNRIEEKVLQLESS